MGIECKIHLEKRCCEDDFKPGDLIQGKVNYTFDEDIQLSGIVLTFRGKARCHWSVQHGKTTTHYIGIQQIFTHAVHLIQQPTPDSKISMAAGSYTQDFQFQLPKNIPYTFEKNHQVYIAYTMKLEFFRPQIFKRNAVFKKTLKVAPFLDLSSNEFCTLKDPASYTITKPHKVFFSKVGEVSARVSLPRTAFLPGESIPVTIEVNNDSNLKLPCVKAKLTKSRVYTATNATFTAGQRVKMYKMSEALPSDVIQPREQKAITCEVLVPHDTLPSLQYCSVIAIAYMLNLKICMPGIHIDARLSVPILIGSALEPSQPPPSTSYNYDAPAYGAPAYGAPAYGAPSYGAPSNGTSPYSGPAYDGPAYGAPAYGAPAYGAPAYGAPAYGEPVYGATVLPPYESPPTYWEAMQLDDGKGDED